MNNQSAHRAKATLIRTGHTVKDLSGNVVCNGITNIRQYPWCKDVSGINAAKRYVRKSGAVSYTL